MKIARSEELSEMVSENRLLKREVKDLTARLEKMQKIFERHHAEIRELKLKAGAKRVGYNHTNC